MGVLFVIIWYDCTDRNSGITPLSFVRRGVFYSIENSVEMIDEINVFSAGYRPNDYLVIS